MCARPTRSETKLEKLQRMDKVQRSAEGIITRHFSKILKPLGPYSSAAIAYGLTWMGYTAFRQYLPAQEARREFKSWSALAKKDKVTQTFVASTVREDYGFLADPNHMVAVANAGSDFVGKHFPMGRLEGCSKEQVAYACIVLAYRTLQQAPTEALPADKIFDLIAIFALRNCDTSHESRSKLH